MKKQLYGIIGLSAAVAVLGGGLAALKLTEKSDSDESSSAVEMTQAAVEGSGMILIDDNTEPPYAAPTTEAYVIGTEPAVDEKPAVSSVHVKNADGELEVKVLSQATADAAAEYTLAGYEEYDLDSQLLSTIVNNVNQLRSASLVEENCSDLSKFGLGDTAIKVDVNYASGIVRTIYIGDTSPVNPQNYVRIDDSNDVYTVNSSSVATYSRKPVDFVRTVVLAEPSAEEYPKINSVRVERQDIDYDIFLVYGEHSDETNSGGTSAVHEMAEPVHAFLSVERSKDITNGMFGLTAKSIDTLGCTDADIKKAGLDEPFCRVTMECDNGKTYVLLLSEMYSEEGENVCRAMLEGGNVIYVVSADKARWLTVTPIDIASRVILGSFVWNVSEFTVENSSGTKATFHTEPTDSSKDRKDCRTEDMTVTKDGEAFDAERYRQLYAFVLDSNGEEFALNEKLPDTKPAVSVKYTDSYLNKTATIDFYDYSPMTSLIAVDGEPLFFCSRSYVETLSGNIDKIETGEAYVTTWK